MSGSRGPSAARSGPLVDLFDLGAPGGQDDAELLERFLGGDPTESDRSFTALVTRHGSLVLGVARSILRDEHAAQDACQATFLILSRRAGAVRRPEALASWLFGVARRVAHRARLDRDRRAARERRVAVPDRTPVAPSVFEPDDRAALIEEVGRLPEHYRSAVILCDLEGLTYEAAARALRCPLGTLSVRLRRARERLRARLTRRGVAPVPTWLFGGVPLPPIPLASVPSPPVAALAARSLLMMRWRSFAGAALGLSTVALAGVGLGVVAWARPQGPASVASASPPASAPVARSWTRPLRSGGTVELVGLTPGAGEPIAWRDPNGRPLAANPPTQSTFRMRPERGGRLWHLAFRVAGTGDANAPCRFTCSPSQITSGVFTRDESGQPLSEDRAVTLILPETVGSLRARFSVAAGLWQTVATCVAAGNESTGFDRHHVVFGTTRSLTDGTALTLSHDDVDDEVRIVAADAGGVEHTNRRVSAWGAGQFYHVEAEFDLPRDQIRELRLQTRPYEAVTFDEIPLPPPTTPKP